MELKTYFDILIGRWRIAAIVACAVFLLAILGSLLIPPTYQAEVRLRVVTPLGGSSGETNYQTTFANRLMNTYAQIATSEQVRSQLKGELGLSSLPEITVRIIPDSEIIYIVVESSNPSTAADTANTLAQILLSYRDPTEGNAGSNELNVLSERGDRLQAELLQYQQQHDSLVQTYSQTTANMDVLERKINLKEDSYRNLSDQYELALVDEAAYTDATRRATKAALESEIARLDQELAALNEEYKDLSTKSSEYMQQIIVLRLSIQETKAAYSDLLSRYDSALLASLRQENAQNIMIISPASVPSQPSGSGRLFIIGLGLLVGMAAGAGAAFVMNYLDPLLFSSEQVEQLTSTAVLGKISKFNSRHLLDLAGNANLLLERDYLILRARIHSLIKSRALQTLLLTSPNRGEGKSTLTHRLALGLAQDKLKVLVIDADLRVPTQHKLFRVTGVYGLSDFLGGGHEHLADIIIHEARPGIDLLPNLVECRNAIELLQSQHWNALVDGPGQYDLILIDTPALLAVPDALTVAASVDGVIVVTRWGQSTTSDIQTTCSSLEAVGANILGTVINQAPMQKESHYYYSDRGRPHRDIEESRAPTT